MSKLNSYKKICTIVYVMYVFIFLFLSWSGAFFLYKGNSYLPLKRLALFLMVVIIILFINYKYYHYISSIYVLCEYLVVGVIFRYIYFIIADVSPVSDFVTPSNFYIYLKQNGAYTVFTNVLSEMDFYQRYYSRYPAWGSYMLIIHKIYDLFGYDYWHVFGVNVVLFVIASVLFYKSFEKKEVALLAVFLLSINPISVVWCSEATPDHITVFLCALFLYLLSAIFNNKISNKMEYIICFAIGIVIAGINLFKPLFILFLLAIGVAIFLFHVTNASKMELKQQLTMFAVIAVSFVVNSYVLNSANCCLIETKINSNVAQSFGDYFLWGFSVDENNDWSTEVGANVINEVISQCSTTDEMIQRLNQKGKAVIIANYKLIPKILYQKYKCLFYSESYSLTWTLQGSGIDSEEFNRNVSYIFHSLQYVLGIASLIIMPISLVTNRNDKRLLFSSVLWIGGICYLTVAAVQPRYRYVFILFQIILTAYSILFIFEKMEQVFECIKKERVHKNGRDTNICI